MAIAEIDRIEGRFSDMKSARTVLEDDLNTIDEFVFRREARFGNQNDRSTFQRRYKGKRGDNTAGKGIDNLISGLESLMFGRAPYKVIPVNDSLRDNQDVEEIGDRIAERLNNAMFNERAGFAPIRRKIFGGAAGYGTAGMMTAIDVAEKALVFTHLPFPQCYLAEDHRGRVTTIYRETAMTAGQAISFFGEGVVSETTRRNAETRPDQKSTYLMAVEPDGSKSPYPGTPPPSKVTYVDTEAHKIIKRGMWRRLRANFVRWEGLENSPYGWAPTMTILDDIKSAQVMHRDNIAAGHQLLRPQIYKAGGGKYTELGRSPNSIVNYAPTTEGGELKFERMPGPENVPFTLEMLQWEQQGIREGLYAHLLNVPMTPDMTATEFLGRLQEIVRAIGPAIGRFIAEWAQPAAANALEMMAADHYFDDILAGTMFENVPIDAWHVDFVSPVDRARDQDDAQSIIQMLQFTASVGGVDQIAMQGFNADVAMHQLREKIGAPAELLKDLDAMQELRATLAQQQAIDTAIARTQQAGDAGQSLVGLDRAAGLAGPGAVQ